MPEEKFVYLLEVSSLGDSSENTTEVFATNEQASIAMIKEALMHAGEGKRVCVESTSYMTVYRSDDTVHEDDWIQENEELLFIAEVSRKRVQ